MAEALERSLKFQSTLSVRRATLAFPRSDVHPKISIHALREESDPSKRDLILAHCRFQSTLSVRRATVDGKVSLSWRRLFQSTLSVRRATCHPHLRPQFVGISIHALREESDKIFYGVHAVRSRFQSTLSVRRATGRIQRDRGLLVISIHALREESDVVEQHAGGASISISIHALREESDHGDVAFWNGAGIFQSTLSVRRATAPANNNVTIIPHFNPRSP